jgi:hypothetical protein
MIIVPFKRQGVEDLVEQQDAREKRTYRVAGTREEHQPALLPPFVDVAAWFAENRSAIPSFPRKRESRISQPWNNGEAVLDARLRGHDAEFFGLTANITT